MMFKHATLIPFLVLAALIQVSVSTALVARATWNEQVLSAHNSNRANYGAKPLTWSTTHYVGALAWAQFCRFQHSDAGGRYGENLYATSGTGDVLTSGMNSWMNEASKYDYNRPGFSAATGHFTQVVWKSTTQVACAVGNCPAGTIFPSPSKFLVCRYTPPGNFAGQFPQNVGRHQ